MFSYVRATHEEILVTEEMVDTYNVRTHVCGANKKHASLDVTCLDGRQDQSDEQCEDGKHVNGGNTLRCHSPQFSPIAR